MHKRTARKILVKPELLTNNNISVEIGTAENRDYPDTIYIYIGFWIKPIECTKDDPKYFRDKLNYKLGNILDYKNKQCKIKHFLKNNYYFPNEKDNIYLYNIPENFNYNSKSNFVFLEVYLHTLNINSKKKYPLNSKKDAELFNECVKVANFLGDNLKFDEDGVFEIKKSQKKKNDDIIVNGIVKIFNTPNSDGTIYLKNTFDKLNFDDLKKKGEIEIFEINDKELNYHQLEAGGFGKRWIKPPSEVKATKVGGIRPPKKRTIRISKN